MIGVDGRVLGRYLGRRWCGGGHCKVVKSGPRGLLLGNELLLKGVLAKSGVLSL